MTVECTQDAIISVTPERGIVTSWNRGAERLFGYGEREMVGRLDRDGAGRRGMPPSLRSCGACPLRSAPSTTSCAACARTAA